jgi:LysR family glycine cleavage system transcriptional activator
MDNKNYSRALWRRSLSHLNGLRAFESAARHLSFVEAAAELGVTPAAVGQQVRALEGHLDVRLFVRQKPRIALTDEGRALAADVHAAFDRLALAVSRLDEGKGRGVLTVTLPPSFAARWLIPRIDRFREAHPDLDVRFDTTDRLVDFARNDIDAGVRYGGGRWPGLEATLLLEEEVFPVCSPLLLSRDPPLCTPRDLKHHTLLHDTTVAFDGGFPTWQAWLDAAGVRGARIRGLHFNSSVLATQAALDGRGVLLGRSVVVADDLAAGRLIRPFPQAHRLASAYYFVHRPEDAARPKVVTFRSFLLAEAASFRKGGLDDPVPSVLCS